MLEGALYHQENAGASLDDAYAYTPVRREFDSFQPTQKVPQTIHSSIGNIRENDAFSADFAGDGANSSATPDNIEQILAAAANSNNHSNVHNPYFSQNGGNQGEDNAFLMCMPPMNVFSKIDGSKGNSQVSSQKKFIVHPSYQRRVAKEKPDSVPQSNNMDLTNQEPNSHQTSIRHSIEPFQHTGSFQ